MRTVALVLEDERKDQLIACSLLEEAGCEVYLTSTVVEGAELISSWLAPERALQDTRVIIVCDLILDVHGFHLAALIRDDQIKGRLRPSTLVALTSGYSSENIHFARLAGCDGIYPKPLTASLVRTILQLKPRLDLPALSEDDIWLRNWLISEGARLIKQRASPSQTMTYSWTIEEVESLLKELSGKGWRLKAEQAMALLDRFGGPDQARAHISSLVSLLGAPYDHMLRYLLAGASIEKSGRLLGYSRSQSYQHFRRLAGRLSKLLNHR